MRKRCPFYRTDLTMPVKVRNGAQVAWRSVETISRGGAYIRGEAMSWPRERLELFFSFPGLAVRRDNAGMGVHFIPYPVGAL